MKNKAIKTITTMEDVLSVLVLIIALSSLSNNSHPVNKANLVFFVNAFHLPSSSSSSSTSTSTSISNRNQQSQQQRRRRQLTQFRVGNKDDSDSRISGPGMDNAFRELEALQSLEDGILERPTEKPREKDEIFTKAMDDLDLKDILSTVKEEDADPPPLESEIELYKDMASELDAASSEEKLIVADVKSDLLLADDDGDDEIDIDNNNNDGGEPTLDTDEFMNKAIEEAFKEAKEQNSNVESTISDKESFLDNKEIMSEIEKIFDKANEELLEGLEEMRSEQVCFECSLSACRIAKNILKTFYGILPFEFVGLPSFIGCCNSIECIILYYHFHVIFSSCSFPFLQRHYWHERMRNGMLRHPEKGLKKMSNGLR